MAVDRFFRIMLWCLRVTVNPDPRRIAVFSSGMLIGSIEYSPIGGHMHPSSGEGASLLWK